MPPGVVTVTSTAPLPLGAVAVTCPSSVTEKDVADLDPKETAVAPVRWVPAMVTCPPPDAGPVLGDRLVTVGAGVDEV